MGREVRREIEAPAIPAVPHPDEGAKLDTSATTAVCEPAVASQRSTRGRERLLGETRAFVNASQVETDAPSDASLVCTPEAKHSARAKVLAREAVRKAQSEARDGDRLSAAIEAILASPEASGASLGLVIRRGGQDLFVHDPDRALNPASNSKLATATFALATLGSSYRFATEILRDTEGNVYVRGGFDPSLTQTELISMARAIKRLAPKGARVIIDNSRFVGPRVPEGLSQYGDQDWDYLTPPEALSFDKNLLHVTVKPGAEAGAPAELEASVNGFTLNDNVVTTAPSETFKVGIDERDQGGVLIRDATGKSIVDVWGTIAADYVKGKALVMKMPDAVEGAASGLTAACQKVGLRLLSPIEAGRAPDDAKVVWTHHSPPLEELLTVSLATSNAFDHEMYALAAAACLSADGKASLASACAELNRFFHSRGMASVVMRNASGVGNLNRISAGDLAAILESSLGPDGGGVLMNALAQPGKTGTLKARMLGTAAEGCLRAKTGTGEGAVCLSGVVTKGDEPIVFSSLLNDYRMGRDGARAVLDAIGITLAELA